ncbi:M23 family metallopeptidase [Colwellia sp. D2M02]|nr:M23 family metallopeptidase [Colwellia sp. D2M02]
MSLTLLYRGKNVRFSMQLNKLRWLTALLCFGLLSGTIIHLIISGNKHTDINQTDLGQYQITKAHEKENLTSIAKPNNEQLTALTIKLAELQSQVLRLNALGERLAADADIPEKEFNFSELPPAGGPSIQSEKIPSKSVEQLLNEISLFESEIKHEEKQLHMLESLVFGHHIENNRYLSGRPISKGWLSSYYGVRKDPFNGKATMHKGIDFAGKEDAAIIATASGIVTWVGKRYGYGELVEINHGDGLKTRYGHNKTIVVAVGDVVEKGQTIARMGSTGRSTGPHVHYEILRNNTQIDPLKFVYRKAKK